LLKYRGIGCRRAQITSSDSWVLLVAITDSTISLLGKDKIMNSEFSVTPFAGVFNCLPDGPAAPGWGRSNPKIYFFGDEKFLFFLAIIHQLIRT
jgi:hypothetical protein